MSIPNDTRQTRARSGFILIAVLWLLVITSALILALASMARLDIRREQNRADGLRAEWMAEGCAESLRASIDGMLGDPSRGTNSADDAWRHLNTRLRSTIPYGMSQ